MPSLSSVHSMRTPAASIGTQMSVLLACAGVAPSALVLASRHIQSACAPLVIHILPPLITKSSPRVAAVVRIAATSEPAPTSLTPRHGTRSPRIVGRRNSSFTRAEPCFASAGVAMSVTTPTAIGTPPQRTLPISSAIATDHV